MAVHRTLAIPDKFKKGKKKKRTGPGLTAEQLQQMKKDLTPTQQVGVRRR